MSSWKRPSLEIHIPISPTPLFANMVHYFVHSLRTYGGAYSRAKVVITVGDSKVDKRWEARNGWLRRNDIEVRWLPTQLYSRWTYFATASERFRYDYRSDMVLMLDADILIRRPFEDMVDQCFRQGRFAGLISHVSPLTDGVTWQKLYDSGKLGEAVVKHEHTGWGYMFDDPNRRYCPPYFNLGVLCASGEQMNAIGAKVYDLMDSVDRVYKTIYKCQLAAGMAVDSLGIPYYTLPMRYNFPNVLWIEAIHSAEAPHAAILHYLKDHQEIEKSKMLHSRKAVEAVLQREDLRVTNAMIREVLRTVHPLVMAEGGPESF